MQTIDQKLDILYQLLITDAELLETEIKALIADPAKIKSTHKFSILLSDLKNLVFIEPLVKAISLSERNDPWLLDFLYAAAMLLDQASSNDEFETPDGLIGKLGTWILDYTGEIAWYAATLLKFCESEKSEKIQLKKLEGRGDFFLTYVECLLGLVRYDRPKHIGLAMEIARDETRHEELRKFASELEKDFYK